MLSHCGPFNDEVEDVIQSENATVSQYERGVPEEFLNFLSGITAVL
jgi:hypothetical protein